MEKRNLKKELRELYEPSAKEVVSVVVPPLRFLMLDGQGDPNTSQDYADALAALYGLSYALKFAAKRGPLAVDYHVMPLEGLWWAEDMSSFLGGDREQWQWTMMILQPDFIDDDLVDEARAQLAKKKSLPALERVRFETYEEGLAAQVMHIGPYAEEGPTIERVHRFIEESGHRLHGKHHEIYLSDPRRSDPAKLKTVIRQPMR